MLKQKGLVLEGGGMRGVYTAGVLDFFMEKDIYFPYVVGVSAGACHATSYISRQPGRNKKVTVDYIDYPNYISYKNLILKGELFGMDLIFDRIPRELEPFDFKTFYEASENFLIGTTDCVSGQPIYYEKNACGDEFLKVVRASSSLPFVASLNFYKDSVIMDGGIADPIPINKAIKDGYQKNVIILTQNKGYRKKKSSLSWSTSLFYKKYKGLQHAINKRYQVYNETIELIERLEEEKKVFVLRPLEKLTVGRVEKDKQKLNQLYNQGYKDASNQYNSLVSWLKQ